MGSMAKSAGGFLGIGNGADAPTIPVSSDNSARDILTKQLESYANNPGQQQTIANYGQGQGTTQDALSSLMGQYKGVNNGAVEGLTTDPLSGSRFATDQVQNNPVLGQLFGQNGLMNQEVGKEQQLQNQGYQLTPEDNTMYGQASGNIARLFGQQQAGASQNLADRGLASAPSGAAGAMFSGLQGNQNEQLAAAQQQIMQQRFQNTMGQIAQQQNFIGQLGNQAQSAIQSQYGRQLAGAQQNQSNMQGLANIQNTANGAQNNAEANAAQFSAANAPKNLMDFTTAGIGQGIQSGIGGSSGSSGSVNGQNFTKSGSGVAGLFTPSAATAV